MAFQIEPDEKWPDGLRRVLKEERREASRQLDKADGSPRATESVHRARKSLKKLRAILRLLKPLARKKNFKAVDKPLRDIGRALSTSRDTQVLASTFDEIAKKHGHQRQHGMVRVSGFLRKEHRKAAADLAGGSKIKRLKAELKSACAALDHLAKKADWNIVQAHLGEIHDNARSAMREAQRTGKPEDFHEWRKRAKDLWYQLRLIGPAQPAALGPEIERLRKIEAALGRDHDLLVLEQRLSANFTTELPAPVLQEWITHVAAEHLQLRREAFSCGEQPGLSPGPGWAALLRGVVTTGRSLAVVAKA